MPPALEKLPETEMVPPSGAVIVPVYPLAILIFATLAVAVSMTQFPVPAPSKYMELLDVGTLAPPGPPEVVDQLPVLDQRILAPIQYLSSVEVPAKVQLVFPPPSELVPLVGVMAAELPAALESEAVT